MNKYILAFILLLAISGCAKKVIYLSTLHGTSIQVQQVKKALESKGHYVELTNVRLPEPNVKTMIIHNPVMNNQAYINNISSTLNANGFNQIDITSFNSSNHFYNELNVGIYLPHISFPVLPIVMGTFKCQGQYGTLETTQDMTLTIKFELEDETESYISYSGNYLLDESGEGYVVTSKGNIYFTLKDTVADTYLGERPAHVLIIRDQEFELLPLPCSFITIYEH